MVDISCESHKICQVSIYARYYIYLIAIIGALLSCHSYNNITSTPIGTELEVVGGVDHKLVNLTVTCDRDAAHLNFSTGGLRVISLRLAQNCTVLGRRNSSGCDHAAVSAHNNDITYLDYHLLHMKKTFCRKQSFSTSWPAPAPK